MTMAKNEAQRITINQESHIQDAKQSATTSTIGISIYSRQFF